MRYELVALLAVIALVVERVLARRELKTLLLALEQSVRAETARFRGEYAREFLSLREDVAHSHEDLRKTVDGRLRAFVDELVALAESLPDQEENS